MQFGANSTQEITLKKLPIELHALLKFANLAQTGGEAKQLIAQGYVAVNNSLVTQKGKKIHAGDRVTLRTNTLIIKADTEAER